MSHITNIKLTLLFLKGLFTHSSGVTGPLFHPQHKNILPKISNYIIYSFSFLFTLTRRVTAVNSKTCDYLSPIFFKFQGRVS